MDYASQWHCNSNSGGSSIFSVGEHWASVAILYTATGRLMAVDGNQILPGADARLVDAEN